MSNKEYMTDPQGRQVPVELVNEIDKLRDQTVKDIIERVMGMRETLNDFKSKVKDDIFAFVNLSAEKYGKKHGGVKGNITLTTYDGKYKILIANNEMLEFDERLQIARELIGECLEEWSDGARAEIKLLVNDAFKVDQKGKVSTPRILGLNRLDIKHPKWQQAMQAINESKQVFMSKKYLRVYERNDKTGEYNHISLDVSAM